MGNNEKLPEIKVVFKKDCTTMNKFIDFIINKLLEDSGNLGGFINELHNSNHK